jgi:acyl-CoA dehydrogenase
MAAGEIFVCVVYAQLVLENARIYGIDAALVDQIFDFMVRDVSKHALRSTEGEHTPDADGLLHAMIRKPVFDRRGMRPSGARFTASAVRTR